MLDIVALNQLKCLLPLAHLDQALDEFSVKLFRLELRLTLLIHEGLELRQI